MFFLDDCVHFKSVQGRTIMEFQEILHDDEQSFHDYIPASTSPQFTLPQPRPFSVIITSEDNAESTNCLDTHVQSQRHVISHQPTKPSNRSDIIFLLNCSPSLSSPIRPNKRANDYTGDFKKEFCRLILAHSEARIEWDRFWRSHGCTGSRPCIKAHLAFCDKYGDKYCEFGILRRNPSFRVLGTRTTCKCSHTIHYFQPPRPRVSPY